MPGWSMGTEAYAAEHRQARMAERARAARNDRLRKFAFGCIVVAVIAAVD